MAIPATALIWPEPMDPYDVLDYTIDVSGLLMGPDEFITAYSVQPMVEALLLGLQIGTGEYATSMSNNVIRVWLSIDPEEQANAAFEGAGATLPLEVSVTTSSVPARKRQRTVVVRVVQR